MKKEQIIKILKSYQAVFYFNDYETKDGIIWGLKSYDDMDNYRPVRYKIANNRIELEKPIFNTMAKFIRDNGSKFDAGGIEGYYYNEDQIIDFEPIDLVIKPDLGFNSLSWFNPKTKEYEAVG